MQKKKERRTQSRPCNLSAKNHQLNIPMKTLITCLLASVLTFGGLAFAESRTWTAAQGGATFEGELREVKGDKVSILRKDGKLFEVPIARLSDADKKFITDSQAKPVTPQQLLRRRADMKIPKARPS